MESVHRLAREYGIIDEANHPHPKLEKCMKGDYNLIDLAATIQQITNTALDAHGTWFCMTIAVFLRAAAGYKGGLN